MPVQSKTTTSREEMMLHVAPLNIQFGQNREHGTSPAWPGANPSADLIVGLDKSSLVFLNRWHHGQSSAEHWGDADDALRVWGAKHGTPGPQYLHPWVPKKHAAADQSHHGKGKQLPDQRWVHFLKWVNVFLVSYNGPLVGEQKPQGVRSICVHWHSREWPGPHIARLRLWTISTASAFEVMVKLYIGWSQTLIFQSLSCCLKSKHGSFWHFCQLHKSQTRLSHIPYVYLTSSSLRTLQSALH